MKFVKLILLFLVCILQDTSAHAQLNHNYYLEFDKALTQVTVKIELAHGVSQLKARNSVSSLFVQEPRDCDSNEIITFKNSKLIFSSKTRCISYSMRLIQKQDRRPFKLNSKTMVSSPAEWLFLPRLKSDSVQVKVSLDTSHQLSVPWQTVNAEEHIYKIDASPESAEGLLVVGNFVRQDIEHKGTQLRVAYLPGKAINYNDMTLWLTQTIDNISTLYGRFPHPEPQIIISPTGTTFSRRKSPVPFGRVVRDSGESVQFFIDQRQSLNDFNKDWTATHEFSHLLLPYVSWKNRWISEGFASYYQNILMARSGQYSEKQAWQKLYDGFMRGKRSVPELSPNSAAREDWGGTMKVYWSGAALAFKADVQLRKESNNTKSLDTTLDALQSCCLPSGKTWSGSQLFRKMDQLSDTKVFGNLYFTYANSSEFIPFEEGFEELGIVIKNNKIKLLNDPVFLKKRKQIIKR